MCHQIVHVSVEHKTVRTESQHRGPWGGWSTGQMKHLRSSSTPRRRDRGQISQYSTPEFYRNQGPHVIPLQSWHVGLSRGFAFSPKCLVESGLFPVKADKMMAFAFACIRLQSPKVPPAACDTKTKRGAELHQGSLHRSYYMKVPKFGFISNCGVSTFEVSVV